MRKKSPRVLLVLGWYDHRLHGGIEKYAQEQGWRLSEDLAREKVIPWGWDGDGILAWLGAGDDLADFVVKAKKPTVDFSFRRSQLKFAHVLEDTTQTAQLVADHFLSRGFRHFLFYSDANNWVYDQRGEAFVKLVQAAGRDAKWLKWHESSEYRVDRKAWITRRKWLEAELKSAPKPVGIFAAADGLALEALEICEDAGIAVPEEVAIVGAGNSLLAVDAMHTPISSVDVNMEMIGYCGAKLLDELMLQKNPPEQIVRVPPFRLIVRKSSDLIAVNHPGIARSLRFMWDHCHELIGVSDLAKVASMSIRNFHQAFVDNVGRPPGNELHRIRIERAKKLLSDSSEKMDAIAEMCGYENGNSFWVAFKRSTGISPKQYQKQLGKK
ncbi:MAG TPA: XylR family transcriptional regulator [Pseudomonadales bacterium]|nr:XylR family transcriptional regulator [Pseudomonadales bacterium]